MFRTLIKHCRNNNSERFSSILGNYPFLKKYDEIKKYNKKEFYDYALSFKGVNDEKYYKCMVYYYEKLYNNAVNKNDSQRIMKYKETLMNYYLQQYAYLSQHGKSDVAADVMSKYDSLTSNYVNDKVLTAQTEKLEDQQSAYSGLEVPCNNCLGTKVLL